MDKLDEIKDVGFVEVISDPLNRIVILTKEQRDWSVKEIEQLRKWTNDLQAGMYINCVYCGHRYGLDTEVPVSMADVLKEHIEQCPKHPLFEAKQEIKRLNLLVQKRDNEKDSI